MSNEESVWKIDDRASLLEIGDETVLALSDTKYLILNRTGLEIINLLDGKYTLLEICEILSQKYQVTMPAIKHEVEAFIARLKEINAVKQIIR